MHILYSYFIGLHDQNSLEECIRFLFLGEASNLINFDLLVSTTVKQPPSRILTSLILKNYEAYARSLIPATDHLFKVTVNITSRSMTIEYLGD
ncbi:hypothetical protein VTP01DRAFT_7938 [Rhizomucor pusillus]|uniref:uncharacterized protein n=1 Tax=Rhizomucor pusillus TaxID=4840 RepID=UPI00374220CD